MTIRAMSGSVRAKEMQMAKTKLIRVGPKLYRTKADWRIAHYPWDLRTSETQAAARKNPWLVTAPDRVFTHVTHEKRFRTLADVRAFLNDPTAWF